VFVVPSLSSYDWTRVDPTASWSHCFRIRMILRAPGTPIPGFNQDTWVTRGHYDKRDPRKSVEQFYKSGRAELRAAEIGIIQVSPRKRRTNQGRAPQIRPYQLRSREISSIEIRVAEIGSRNLGFPEIQSHVGMLPSPMTIVPSIGTESITPRMASVAT
jgi:hypothetical protein